MLYSLLLSSLTCQLFLQILDALNKGEIPTTGSLVEVFNKEIVERCLKLYSQSMDRMMLPLPEDNLQQAHDQSKNEAMKVFDEQHFGRRQAKQSLAKLEDEIQKAHLFILSLCSN